MKKTKTLLALSATVLTLGLASCGGKNDVTPSESTKPSETTSVVTPSESTKPSESTSVVTPSENTSESTPSEVTPVEVVRDGKTIDTAFVVDIYRENTFNFELKKNESLFLKFGGDGEIDDFYFEVPEGSGLSFTYAWYYEDKTLNVKETEAETCLYKDVNGTRTVDYLEIIPQADGKYSYIVTNGLESTVGRSFEEAIKLTYGAAYDMKDAKAGTYYFEFTIEGISEGGAKFEVFLSDLLESDKAGHSVYGMVGIFDSNRERVSYPEEDLISFYLPCDGTYYAVVTMIKDGSFNILVQ